MIAVGQLTSTNSLVRNGKAAARLVKEAHAKKARVLFLPEASDYIAGSPQETVALAQEVDQSPFIKLLRDAIKSNPIHVSVGVHEPALANKVKNTLLWFDPEGNLVNRYQKIHLFDVDVPNGPILRESLSVEAGKRLLLPFETPVGKLASSICYDIRFPEQSLALRKSGAEIICFPSAFTVKTGIAHWHALSRARAIDTQCYVVNAAQVGQHDAEGKRKSYGHSLVVDPWGTIIAEATTDEEQVILAQIDLEMLEKIRANMPLWEQRKGLPDL